MTPPDLLLRKLRQHSRLDPGDVAAIRKLSFVYRELESGEDFCRQGDKATACAVVSKGMLARYHTMSDGKRQYISLHMSGDWADAQGLFLDHMDHSICAMDDASVYSIPHHELFALFKDRPQIGFVIWRETLIDASIFRMTITNNSSRHGAARLAHFFAEIYYRAVAVGLEEGKSCSLPLSQTQLGEALGMSIATVNRNLQKLRRSGAAEWSGGLLTIKNWEKLTAIGGFDASYIYQKVQGKR